MHIDDIETTEELCKLTREQLSKIEGAEGLVEAMDRVAKFAKNCADTLPYLSITHNWYLEPTITTNILNQLFNTKDELTINNILIKYYKDNMELLIDKLKELFPKRKPIFDEILYAHKNEKYYLSCISIMTQIDGVVYDIFNNKNFFHGDFVKIIIDKIEKIKEQTVGTAFLKSLFDNNLPIKLSQEKRGKIEFIHLNRHQIIHGETVDFNTEIYSLKALSLLFALAFNLKYLQDNYYEK